MADTVRTKSDLLGLFQNNLAGEITAQDLRDFVVSSQIGASASITGGTVTGVPLVDDGGQVFNICSPRFGGIGNGIFDNSSALSAAISAAAAVKGTVYIPAGTFMVTNVEVVGVTGVSVVGAAGAVIQAKLFNTNTWTGGTNFHLLRFTGCTDVSVRGIKFVGNHTLGNEDDNHVTALRFSSCTRPLAESVVVDHFDIGITFDSSSYSKASHCYITYGDIAYYSLSCTATVFESCVAYDLHYSPYLIGTQKQWQGYGFYSKSSTGTRYSHCTAARCGSDCFRFDGADAPVELGSVAIGCVAIQPRRYGFTSRGQATRCTWIGCKVELLGDETVWNGATGSSTEPASVMMGWLLHGYAHQAHGCSVYGAPNVTNAIPTRGFEAAGDSMEVVGCRVVGSFSQFGIGMLTDTGDSGTLLAPSARASRVVGCCVEMQTLVADVSSGVSCYAVMDGDDHLFADCVAWNGRDSVTISGGNRAKVRGMVCNVPARIGVYVFIGDRHMVSDCYVVDAAKVVTSNSSYYVGAGGVTRCAFGRNYASQSSSLPSGYVGMRIDSSATSTVAGQLIELGTAGGLSGGGVAAAESLNLNGGTVTAGSFVGSGSGLTSLSSASLLAPVTSKTGAYSINPSSDFLVLCDATSGAFTATLPAAAAAGVGRVFVVKKVDSSGNAVTVGTTASQTIDGVTTKSLASQWSSIRVQSNGTAWFVV